MKTTDTPIAMRTRTRSNPSGRISPQTVSNRRRTSSQGPSQPGRSRSRSKRTKKSKRRGFSAPPKAYFKVEPRDPPDELKMLLKRTNRYGDPISTSANASGVSKSGVPSTSASPQAARLQSIPTPSSSGARKRKIEPDLDSESDSESSNRPTQKKKRNKSVLMMWSCLIRKDAQVVLFNKSRRSKSLGQD